MLCVLALAASAHAATVSFVGVDGESVAFTAAPGEANRLQIDVTRAAVQFSDAGAPVTAGTGCAQITSSSVNCALASFPQVMVDLGDSNDALEVTYDAAALPLPVWADGGPGDDRLVTGRGNDHLDGGGGGHDTLEAGPGTDFLTDGDVRRGGDLVVSAVDADVLDGGASHDAVSYGNRTSRVAVDLRRSSGQGEGGENDTLRNIESVDGGSGNDHLVGNSARNVLNGGYGSDLLEGRAGSDMLLGGPGDDRLLGGVGDDKLFAGERDPYENRKHGRDVVGCGTGADSVWENDVLDVIEPDCERGRTVTVYGLSPLGLRPRIKGGDLIYTAPCMWRGGGRGATCSLAISVRDERHHLLGRGSGTLHLPRERFRRIRYRPLRVPVRLTARGRDVVRRGGARVYVTVSSHSTAARLGQTSRFQYRFG